MIYLLQPNSKKNQTNLFVDCLITEISVNLCWMTDSQSFATILAKCEIYGLDLTNIKDHLQEQIKVDEMFAFMVFVQYSMHALSEQ